MKKRFYLIYLLFIFITVDSKAQNQSTTNYPVKGTLIKDLHAAPINSDFKGIVILNDRLLEKGLKSIASFPVDTVKAITYIKPLNVSNSLVDIDPACQFGILILDTSSAEPTILSRNLTSSNLEQIILNSKKILYKNKSQEPD